MTNPALKTQPLAQPEAEPKGPAEGEPLFRAIDAQAQHTHILTMNYRDIITIEPGKRSGKPCILGLRITVYDVLAYLASGMSEAEILEDFPELTAEEIRACLAFAADRERRLAVIPAE